MQKRAKMRIIAIYSEVSTEQGMSTFWVLVKNFLSRIPKKHNSFNVARFHFSQSINFHTFHCKSGHKNCFYVYNKSSESVTSFCDKAFITIKSELKAESFFFIHNHRSVNAMKTRENLKERKVSSVAYIKERICCWQFSEIYIVFMIMQMYALASHEWLFFTLS